MIAQGLATVNFIVFRCLNSYPLHQSQTLLPSNTGTGAFTWSILCPAAPLATYDSQVLGSPFPLPHELGCFSSIQSYSEG